MSRESDAASESPWKPIQKVRAYEQVVQQIEDQILTGRLQPGDRLPAERQLSNELGVSRASVREALRVMEALEVVTVRPGTGPDAGSVVVGEPGSALGSLLRLHVALQYFSMDDVMEARTAIETTAARLASERAEQGDLERLERILEDMEDSSLSPAEFNELDTDFHVGVARASQNDMLIYLMEGIREAVRRWMIVSFNGLEDWASTADQLRAQHRRLFEQVRDQESDGAAATVERHIADFYLSSKQRALP